MVWLKERLVKIGSGLAKWPMPNLGAAMGGLQPVKSVGGKVLSSVRQRPYLYGSIGVFLSGLWWVSVSDVTTGDIIISSPAIYTRERLVNDRLREETRLKRILQTDTSDPGVAAVRSSRNATRLSLVEKEGYSAGSSAPPTEGKSETTSDTKTEEDQGKGGGNVVPRVSALEDFRDRQAYRDEVRDTLLETALDDRHDIEGNTVYRLKFDVTLLPRSRSKDWVVVFAEIARMSEGKDAEDDYRWLFNDWMSKYEEALNAAGQNEASSFRSTAVADEQVDRLMRFVTRQFEGEPAGNVRERLEVVDAEREKKEEMARELNRLLEEVDRKFRASASAPRPPDLKADPRAERARYQKALTAADEVFREKEAKARDFRIRVVEAEEEANRCDELFEVNSCRMAWTRRLRVLIEAYRDKHVPRASLGYALLRALLDRRTEEINAPPLSTSRVQRFLKAQLKCDDVKECRIVLLPKTGTGKEPSAKLVKDFGWELNHQAALYAYSATPRESAQRLLSSTSVGNRLALDLRGGLPSEYIQSLPRLMQWYDEKERRQTAMLRRPLVVGIADWVSQGDDGSEGKVGTTPEKARFGWIVGPRVEISASEDAVFRHVPTQMPLSAVVSVPGWWRHVLVRSHACWVSEDGPVSVGRSMGRWLRGSGSLVGLEECREAVGKRKGYRIVLPIVSEEISRVLGQDLVRRPFLKAPRALPVVRIGERASVLIEGGYLWRSTVVTLGGQPATSIEVLPNMQGIVATFDRVWAPTQMLNQSQCQDLGRTASSLGHSKGESEAVEPVQAAELRVWTSEGVTEPVTVCVRPQISDADHTGWRAEIPRKDKMPKADQPPSPRVGEVRRAPTAVD